MQQIKNYLSQLHGLKNVLLLSATSEFEQLSLWLTDMQMADYIFRSVSEKDNADIHFDAVIFDYGCGAKLKELSKINSRFIIGRTNQEEDPFELWEVFRKSTSSIYIAHQENGKAPQVLDWDRGSTDIELSVVIPVYNVAEYLPRCIKSLIEWEASYVEYIFVNDGSRDRSRDVILDCAKYDKRVRLIDKENGGCASARNRGIQEARGKYIGFVDSDDFIDASMFQKLIRRALIGNYDLAYCGYREYYEETQASEPVLNDCLGEPYSEGTYRADKVQLLAVNTRVAIWRCIYKKEVLDQRKISFLENLKRFDDLPFRIEYIFAAKSAVCVPEYLYYYRLGRKGQDTSCTDKGLFVHFEIFEHLDQYVDKYKDKRLKDLLQVVKVQTHGYGLSRIEKTYRKEYLKKAMTQLDRNMGYWRTVCLIMIYTGKKNLGWYSGGKIRWAIIKSSVMPKANL